MKIHNQFVACQCGSASSFSSLWMYLQCVNWSLVSLASLRDTKGRAYRTRLYNRDVRLGLMCCGS